MKIDVLTIFPGLFGVAFGEGLLGRAVAAGLLELGSHDLRRFTTDRHRSIDDETYGGGAGMVYKAEPILRAVDELGRPNSRLIFMSPQGQTLTHDLAIELAQEEHLLILTARYEGVDERVLEGATFEEVSIGDYVVMGGEAPALVLIEAATRHVPGVVGDPESIQQDSFATGWLDHPHFTRPAEVRGMKVPDILLTGHHERIRRWRLEKALAATIAKRPDLLDALELDAEGREILSRLRETDD